MLDELPMADGVTSTSSIMNDTAMLEELPVADAITSTSSLTAVKLESSKPQSSNATFSDLTEIPLHTIIGFLSKTELQNISLVSKNLKTLVQERIFTRSKKQIFKTFECGTHVYGKVIRWNSQKLCSVIQYDEINKLEIILWGTDYLYKTVKHEVNNRLVQKKGMKVTYDGMTGTVVENKQPNNLHILWFGDNMYRVATYEECNTLYMIDAGDHYVDETATSTLSWIPTKHDANWMEMYNRLVAYKKQYKSTCVPQRYQEDTQLGKWVGTQRVSYNTNKSCLTADRIAQLDSIGFVWNPRDHVAAVEAAGTSNTTSSSASVGDSATTVVTKRKRENVKARNRDSTRMYRKRKILLVESLTNQVHQLQTQHRVKVSIIFFSIIFWNFLKVRGWNERAQ